MSDAMEDEKLTAEERFIVEVMRKNYADGGGYIKDLIAIIDRLTARPAAGSEGEVAEIEHRHVEYRSRCPAKDGEIEPPDFWNALQDRATLLRLLKARSAPTPAAVVTKEQILDRLSRCWLSESGFRSDVIEAQADAVMALIASGLLSATTEVK
jgi:hypothetical protein